MSFHVVLQVAPFLGQVVRMKAGIGDYDTAFELGMLGLVAQVKVIDFNLFRLEIDVRPFDELNTGLMPFDYFDEGGNPVLTAKQDGFWSDLITLYAGPPSDWPARFDPIGPVDLPVHRFRDQRGSITLSLAESHAAFVDYGKGPLPERVSARARVLAGLSPDPAHSPDGRTPNALPSP